MHRVEFLWGINLSTSSETTLSYAHTVTRSLVHRAAICEVLLTDVAQLSEQEYVIAAQLPRVHSYYNDHISSSTSYDPLLLVEAFRQTSILVAHEFLGVPIDDKFVFNSGELLVTDPSAPWIGGLPGRAEIVAVHAGLKHRESVVIGSTLDMVLTVDGKEAATMRTTTQWMPSSAWARLREKGRAALELTPVRPHHTGRRIVPVHLGVVRGTA
ncbi:AfsA-related hotdog domain-containing protein [Nocardia sp. CNY236]|uniref:AfsA-related hotdog domain-containing protein n=1 Tax=Nocardia sp. CNY236 TaxID=1169152 RepID=UPI0021019EDB|nr:AfsA-related hotdog domain-containing protein [Nocardia sp. CNY236]